MNTTQDTIRDLIADARVSLCKDELSKDESEYLATLLEQIKRLFARRHTSKPDQYGWFEELELKGFEDDHPIGYYQ